MTWRVEIYNGHEHPAAHPYRTMTARDEKQARRYASQWLGHNSLRGAASWDRYQGGTVYQFGPREEYSDNDFAVIIDEEDEREEQRMEDRWRSSEWDSYWDDRDNEED